MDFIIFMFRHIILDFTIFILFFTMLGIHHISDQHGIKWLADLMFGLMALFIIMGMLLYYCNLGFLY